MNYAKAGVAIVVTVIMAIIAAMAGDDLVSATEWVNVAIAGVGAAAVFASPNVRGSRYTKAVLAVLTAVLTVLVSAIVDGITTTELLQILVAAAGAIGVYAVPNKGTEQVTA